MRTGPFFGAEESGTQVVKTSGMNSLAVTYWNGIISPLFDAAEQFLVLSGSDRGQMLPAANMTVYQKVMLLKQENICALICGAISQHAQDLLEQQGIVVHPWLCGRVRQAVRAFEQGNVDQYFMPGHRCRRNRTKGCGKCNRRLDS